MTTSRPARRTTPARVGGHRRALLVLLVAVLGLAATVALRPPHAPPLYDGLGFPDEPYRWLVPPAGAAKTPAWTPATASLQVTAAGAGGTRGFSAEQGPQVAFAVTQGTLDVPSGTTGVTITARAARPPAVAPPRGTLVSNVYAFATTLTGAAGSPSLKPGTTMIVNLRAAKEQPKQDAVVVEQWDGTTWSQVYTKQVGVDIYAASVPSLRSMAVVRLDAGVSPTVTTPPGGPAPSVAAPATAATTPAAPSSSPTVVVLGVAGAVLLLVVGGLLVLRLRARS